MSETLRLKITGGAAAGKELVVADELVIGREAPGEGMIADDVEISRQHARISRTPQDEWGVEDLGSRNGTFVNGHRIEGHELLAAGDSIEVGGTRLVVQVSSPAAPPPAAPEPTPEPVPEPTQEAEPAQEEEPAPAPEPAPLGDTLVGDVVSEEPPELEPAPAPAPEPEVAESVAQEAPAAPAVSVALELDPAAGEAVISLGPGGDTVRFVFQDGVWRVAPEA